MNALEKYAAKKRLSKEMVKRLSTVLYGKKPGQKGAATGAALGGVSGAALGGAAGLRAGMGAYNKQLHKDWQTALYHMYMWPLTHLMYGGGGALAGGVPGAVGGAALGKLLGKSVDKARMAKYLANKKKVNKRLAIGAGAGGLTLGGLLGGKVAS